MLHIGIYYYNIDLHRAIKWVPLLFYDHNLIHTEFRPTFITVVFVCSKLRQINDAVI